MVNMQAPEARRMASRAICAGVGIPMMAVGALIAVLWAPAAVDLAETVEFIGSTIGILGAVFFIAGLFYTSNPVMR